MTTYADATDKTVDTIKQGARAMTDRLDFLATMPSLDFVEPVERYFDYLQKAVDLNREMLVRWAELASQMSGTFRDEALKAGHTLEGQVEEFADKTGELARKGKDVADKVIDETGKLVDEARNTAVKAADTATDTVEHVTDEAADTASDLADDATESAQKTAGRARRR
jgi:methyl-accepting chemotaxis protein